MNSYTPPNNFQMLLWLNELDLSGLFFQQNNSLGQVITQFKKSRHKSSSFRHESISKLPRGLSLFLGHYLHLFRYCPEIYTIFENNKQAIQNNGKICLVLQITSCSPPNCIAWFFSKSGFYLKSENAFSSKQTS